MRRPTILLTGATGHLGAAIAKELLGRPGPPNLRLLIRNEEKLRKLANSDPAMEPLRACERVVTDIRDVGPVERAVAGADAVIHACHSHEYWNGAPYLLSVNVGGARNIVRSIRASSSVKKVVFIGSYSAHHGASFDDDLVAISACSARECSSRSKRLAQEIFRASTSDGRFRLDIVSPSYLIGPFQLEPTYFGALFHRVLLGPLRWCPPNGINVVDVRDVARIVGQCATTLHMCERRILASGDNISLRELFGEMNRQAGFTTTPRRVPSGLFLFMPRLKQFGAFGRQYFRNNHYVDEGGLRTRRYALAQSIRDTLSWAKRWPMYTRRSEFIWWFAERYLL
ncbi:MAG TPA: NAD-dependent epimerase/dehydratase family protein [Xanthobacteraceae bacterium]|nr:NAD-dependent epimerase/dehydratase family protein [Xanthobacteraceae bacterium]